jgi:hypothetical protein
MKCFPSNRVTALIDDTNVQDGSGTGKSSQMNDEFRRLNDEKRPLDRLSLFAAEADGDTDRLRKRLHPSGWRNPGKPAILT